MIDTRYVLKATFADGVHRTTWTRKRRKIHSITRMNKGISGNLEVVYSNKSGIIGSNDASFEDRDHLLWLVSCFSEGDLLDHLTKANPHSK